jgi:hypothetical protein
MAALVTLVVSDHRVTKSREYMDFELPEEGRTPEH